VKKIHCDQNFAFQATAKKEGLGFHFEFMAHQTLQQHGQVKHKFTTLFGRVQSMLGWPHWPAQRHLPGAVGQMCGYCNPNEKFGHQNR